MNGILKDGEYMDKNGDWTIYCLRCSGGSHEDMNKHNGMGICYLTDKTYAERKWRYSFKCKQCGYINDYNDLRYVENYAIR